MAAVSNDQAVPEAAGPTPTNTITPVVKYTVEELSRMQVLFSHKGDHETRALAAEKQKEFEKWGGKIKLVHETTGLPATNDDLAKCPKEVKIQVIYTNKYKDQNALPTTTGRTTTNKAKTPKKAKGTGAAAKSPAAPKPANIELSSMPAPETELAGLGWTRKEFMRQGGATKGSSDKYWYSPKLEKKMRSMTEVRRFLKCLEMTKDSNEQVAFDWMKQGKGKD